jgi:broad specificity phosphatase PhoE
MTAELWLLRHGQASLGSEDYDRLSELGFRQAALAGEALAARRFQPDRVIRGTLRRQRESAEACLAALDCSIEPEVDPGWDEFDHVAVLVAARPSFADTEVMNAELARDGDPVAGFVRVFKGALQRWMSGEHDDEYPESWPQTRSRVAAALRRVEASLRDGERALISTSGGVIGAACAGLLGLADDRVFDLVRALANGSLCRLIRTPGGLRLATFNETAHLEREPGSLTWL